MSVQDDLATLQANHAADATALSNLEAELNSPAAPSVGDKVLDSVVQVLEAAGYTVTPPAPSDQPAGESAPSDNQGA